MTASDKLINLYFEDKLTTEQREELVNRLKTDQEFAILFARLGVIESCIRNEFVEADLRQSLSCFSHYDTADDTGQTATESILKGEDETSDPEQIQKIEAYAQAKLNRYMQDQERLRETVQDSHQPRFFALFKQIPQQCRNAYRVGIHFTTRVTIGVSALAAIIILSLSLVQYVRSKQVVATLGETLYAQWEEVMDSNELRRGWLLLEKGYAKVHFKKGAEILLQAPCEFKLTSKNSMELGTGSMTAYVPDTAKGFTVLTPSTNIIDYGTEFGVSVDGGHHSEIHVFKGEVGLKSSRKRSQKQSQRLKGGQAALAGMRGDVQVLSLTKRPSRFVRQIPDKKTFGIPGVRLDLADIIGGGSGFGTGQKGGGGDSIGSVNPLTGYNNDPWRPDSDFMSNRYDNTDIVISMQYTKNDVHPFIDGTSIPDGSQGTCVVSSEGHTFIDCPVTDSTMKWNITNGWRYSHEPYGYRNSQKMENAYCISMHANSLITFDLEQIRQSMPGSEIVEFSSLAGIPEFAPELSDGDIWILIDGKCRFHEENIQAGHFVDIQIDISPNERFLTLVATDGQSPDYPFWSHSDWLCFMKTCLILKPKPE